MYDQRMSARLFLRLLFAFALAFSGSAAQLHALSHAQFDLAAAGNERGHKVPAPLKHATDQCLVVHALDGTAAEAGAFLLADVPPQHVVPCVAVLGGEARAAAYQSRAPPLAA